MKNELEIFLITYNRLNHLRKTLQTIFMELSGFCDHYFITVLDNNSNDGTSELCQEYMLKMHNLKHIKHNKNIGLSGNVCRAIELSSKKYFWILCDNDDLDFSAWREVEKAMSDGEDLILICTDYMSDENKKPTSKYFRSLVLNQLTFLPSGIYKTKHVTDIVMCCVMANIHTVLPHLVLGCAAINRNDSIYVVHRDIVKYTHNVIWNKDLLVHDRVENSDSIIAHVRTLHVNFYAGVASCFDSCRDKIVREQAIINFSNAELANGIGPVLPLEHIWDSLITKNTPLYIFIDFFYRVPSSIKRKFIKIVLKYISKRLMKSVFSVTNDGSHKLIRIFGVRIRVRR